MKQQSTTLLFLFLMIGFASISSAQELTSVKKWIGSADQFQGLTDTDVQDMIITDRHEDKNAGITWIYLQQAINGIPIYQTNTAIVIKDGKHFCSGHAFHGNIDREKAAIKPLITPSQAVYKAANDVGVSVVSGLREVKNSASLIQLQAPDMRDEEITGKLVYIMKDGKPVLSYLMDMFPKATNDTWSIGVDASTGEVLSQANFTTYCAHAKLDAAGAPAHCSDHEAHIVETVESAPPVDGSRYNVFAQPIESPNYGERGLSVEPADPQWAPYGWHDVDGVEGPEFTTTEGNYVIAILDRNGDRTADGPLPDGGEDLVFDFPFDADAEPEDQTDNAIVQAFYTTNVMHDFAFRYGFDEQIQYANNNYSNNSRENDRVTLQVQSDALNGETNNANFSAPRDGINGNMNIFVGENGASGSFKVDSPSEIEGTYLVGLASYGRPIDDIAVTGKIVQAFDDTGNPEFGCDDIVNDSEVAGNVAMIDRGSCFFQQKTLNAEAAGAIAMIICNYENNVGGLGQGGGLANPSISSVMLSSGDCLKIKQVMNNGGEVVVTFQRQDDSGPTFKDIALDNGVVAHEYGHGLSIRATGGPSDSGCLSNDEQMGEGWSDYFGLVTSVLPGQDGTEARGIGTYGFGQDANGPGIRRFPYSTDKAVNGQDYDDIIGTTAPHPLGEVWADALWDMYWLFVDRYGWDEDFTNGTGGNNQAIQLVFDGMKTQSCNPSFIDGRDAILMADEVRNGGVNLDIIWQAFAGRGLGFSADDGENTNRNDGRAAFDLPSFLINDIVMTKKVSPLVLPGDEIEVEVTITNQKDEAVTNVAFTEQIPEGLSFVSSENDLVISSGNELVSDIGEMAVDETVTLRYVYVTDASKKSRTFFYDDHEDRDISRANWESEILDGTFEIERTNRFDAFSGDFYFEAIPEGDDQVATDVTLKNNPENLKFDLSRIENPVLRFYHYYETDYGFDGGFIQVKPTSSSSWSRVEDDMFRGDYRGEISYNAFTLPNVRAFWGTSGGEYIASYVDLSDWSGENELDIRWRFGALAEASVNGEWRIDDIEIMDMVNYNPVSVVTTAEGDEIEIVADERGTIIETDKVVGIIEVGNETFSFNVFPNPADDYVNIQLNSTASSFAKLQITSVDGRILNDIDLDLDAGRMDMNMVISDLPSGMYFATLLIQGQSVTERFIKR